MHTLHIEHITAQLNALQNLMAGFTFEDLDELSRDITQSKDAAQQIEDMAADLRKLLWEQDELVQRMQERKRAQQVTGGGVHVF